MMMGADFATCYMTLHDPKKGWIGRKATKTSGLERRREKSWRRMEKDRLLGALLVNYFTN